jgi:hypothetical protein
MYRLHATIQLCPVVAESGADGAPSLFLQCNICASESFDAGKTFRPAAGDFSPQTGSVLRPQT